MTSVRTTAEWVFTSLDARKFARAACREGDSVVLRETSALNVKVYWKSMAEMFVPLSLLESTVFAQNQIFEAISLEDLRSLMNQ